MRKKLKISIDSKQIASFCQKWHIASLSLFGSILTDAFNEKSDVDFLAQFKKNHTPSLFDIYDMQQELEAIVGRKVDLKTPKGLSRYFRDEVLAEAKLIYGT